VEGRDQLSIEIASNAFVHRGKNFRTGEDRNMQNLSSMVEKYQVVGRNFWVWGRPVIAKIWISVAFFLR